MFKKLLLTTALVLLPSTAFAQWVPVSQSPQGDLFSVNKDDIGVNGNVRVFWVNVDHASGNVATSRTVVAANCATNSYTWLWLIQGNKQGQVVTNSKLNMPVEQAQHGSVNSQLINAVCTGFVSDPQLVALTRARQSSSDAITKAMETAAQMFR